MDSIARERWEDFAVRMANACYADNVNPDIDWILGEILFFFDCLGAEDVLTFKSWDSSGPYRQKTGYFESPTRDCECRHKPTEPSRSSVPPDPACPNCLGDSDWRRMAQGPYVCDILAERESDALSSSSFPGCAFCNQTSVYSEGQDSGLDKPADCTCDEERYDWEEEWIDKFFGPVRCCLRAGMDFAAEPSSGVLGFTAGDVRRMYPEGVPDWVFPPDQRLHYAFANPPAENGFFSELADSDRVML